MTFNTNKNPALWFIYTILLVVVVVAILLIVKQHDSTATPELLSGDKKDIMFCSGKHMCASTREGVGDCGPDCRAGIMPVEEGSEPVYCCLKNQDWERKPSGIGNGTYQGWESPLVYLRRPNNNFVADQNWYTITKDNQRCTNQGYSCNIEGDVKRGKFVGEKAIFPNECAKICKDDNKCLSFSANNAKGNCIFNYKGVCGPNGSNAKYKLSVSPMSRIYPEACTDGWRYYVKQPLSPEQM